MFCSISGGVPEEPVVDKATGHLYEKRLVTKYIQETGKSPVTGDTLSADDLVPVKSNSAVKPRPSPATSIPGLLSLFHNEWDALMLETHALRQSLGTTRQELSQALYQHDASVRVIARLIRERDEARAALEHVRAGGAVPAEAGAEANGKRAVPAADEESAPAKKAKAGITADIIEAMTKHSATLSKGRKKRQPPASLASAEEVGALALAGTFPLHKTTQGGILAIDFEAGREGLLFTAGADHTGQVYDRQAGRVTASLTGHTKKVTDIKLVKGAAAVVTTSADKTARLWAAGGEGGYSCAALLKEHAGEVTAATLHATGDYFATASLDRTWAFYDVATATCLQQVGGDKAVTGDGYAAACFHPDGLILGTGTRDSAVRVWELRQQKNVATLQHAEGAVTSLSFSENGYYLATAGGDGVKLWDLRKLLNFRTLPGPAAAVAFDHSGLFLAAAGQEVRVFGVKQDWAVVKAFADLPKKGALSAKWGADAKSLYVGASDHNLRVYDLSAGAAPME